MWGKIKRFILGTDRVIEIEENTSGQMTQIAKAGGISIQSGGDINLGSLQMSSTRFGPILPYDTQQGQSIKPDDAINLLIKAFAKHMRTEVLHTKPNDLPVISSDFTCFAEGIEQSNHPYFLASDKDRWIKIVVDLGEPFRHPGMVYPEHDKVLESVSRRTRIERSVINVIFNYGVCMTSQSGYGYRPHDILFDGPSTAADVVDLLGRIFISGNEGIESIKNDFSDRLKNSFERVARSNQHEGSQA